MELSFCTLNGFKFDGFAFGKVELPVITTKMQQKKQFENQQFYSPLVN